jgi:hypothetical protein
MARKRRDAKKWIAANDPIFTGDPYDLARAFLDGYVNELNPFFTDIPDPAFKFLRPGSPEETRAREALAQAFRSQAEAMRNDFMRALRENLEPPFHCKLYALLVKLADLFAEQEESPYRLPQRKLVFKARSTGRQSHYERDQEVACFIYDEKTKRRDMESAVAAARDRFGGSRDYVFGVCKEWRKEV